MATYYQELRDAVLTYLQIAVGDEGDFTRGTTDVILRAVNNAIIKAQKRHDFYMLYETVAVTVDPTLGVNWMGGEEVAWTATGVADLHCVLTFFIMEGVSGVLPADVLVENVTEVTVPAGNCAGTYTIVYYASGIDRFVGISSGSESHVEQTATVTGKARTPGLRKLQGVYQVVSGQITPVRWTTQQNLAEQKIRYEERNMYSSTIDDDRVIYSASTDESYRVAEIVKDTLFLHPAPTADVSLQLTGWKWCDLITDVTDTNFFLDYGFDWLMWQTVIELNYITKQFVGRQEGNLGAPTALAKEAWEDLMIWDAGLTSEEQYIID